MSDDNKRDLNADLAVCASATEGPWYTKAFGGVYAGTREVLRREQGARGYGGGDDSAHRASMIANNTFASEARIGWPHAIERAMAAESEVGRLKRELAWHVDMRRDVIDGCRNERADAIAEITRLRAALEFIVKESACRGVNCSWGDDCFGVVANKALNPEVNAE